MSVQRQGKEHSISLDEVQAHLDASNHINITSEYEEVTSLSVCMHSCMYGCMYGISYYIYIFTYIYII